MAKSGSDIYGKTIKAHQTPRQSIKKPNFIQLSDSKNYWMKDLSIPDQYGNINQQ